MKKTLIIISILLTTTALYGCSNTSVDTSESTDNTTSPTETIEEEIDISSFPELETISENLDVYRQEVSKRLNSLGEDDNFITDEEWSAISTKWINSEEILYFHSEFVTGFNTLYDETSKYYCPVVFREENGLVMYYTDENANVFTQKLTGTWNSSNFIGNLHSDNTESIYSDVDYTLTYTQETGQVTVWNFGKDISYYSVPEGSVYCGISYFEGYIFRNGTDVYAVQAEGVRNADGTVECIAHDVEYVIDTDYAYGSDPWCQPLFKMTDGSIKAYIGWEGDENAAPDDTSHLCDLRYEGGYK